jgi:hypothetical protein
MKYGETVLKYVPANFGQSRPSSEREREKERERKLYIP